jgi:hypothetical protein
MRYFAGKWYNMKFFLKNGGILLVLIGTLLLIIPFFLHFQSNTSLFIAWTIIITGFIFFILLNKKVP